MKKMILLFAVSAFIASCGNQSKENKPEVKTETRKDDGHGHHEGHEHEEGDAHKHHEGDGHGHKEGDGHDHKVDTAHHEGDGHEHKEGDGHKH